MIRTFGISRAAPLIFAAGVLALCPGYLAAVRLPAFGLFHDDGIYLVTAQSIARGHGYHITSLPSEPRQTKYPPLFPLLLATVWKLSPDFPRNLWLLKLVPLLGTVAWLALSLRLLRELGLSPPVRSLVCFVTAAAPVIVYLSVTVLSETLFAALCTGALLCLETDGSLSLKRVALAGVLAGLASLTRIAGVSLIVAGTAWLLLSKRRPGQAALFGGIAGSWLVPWWIWSVNGDAAGYYGAANYLDWNVLTPGNVVALSQRVNVVFTNMLSIAAAGPALLGGPLNVLSIGTAIWLLGVGTWRVLPQRRLSLWFLIAYAALITLWAWPPLRFVAVVLPLLIWVAFAAVAKRPIAASALMIVLTLAGARSSWAAYQNVRDAGRTGVLGVGLATENWDDVEAVGQWLRTHTAADDIVVGNLDPLYFLLSGRKAIRAFEADPFRLFYANAAGANPLGGADVLLSRVNAMDGAVVIEGPDVLFAERPWLSRQIGELESRGALRMVERIGAFRILKPLPN